MRISNVTHWCTDHLRAFVQRVALNELSSEQRRRLRVEVTYNRGGDHSANVTGWAPYNGGRIRIMVPSGSVDRVDLAFTIAHEIGHSRGMTHRQMRGNARYDMRVPSCRDLYAWATELPLDRKPSRPRPTPEERRQVKLDRAKESLAEWQRRAKLAATKIRRWRRRVRALEYAMQRAAKRPVVTP